MGMLLNNGMPIGTTAEVLAAGLAGQNVKACGPEAPGVASCDYYNKNCVFTDPTPGGNGDFMGKGPKNIAFYHKLSPVDGGASTCGQCPCYRWMAVFEGPRQKMNETGEILGIIGQEGDTYIDSALVAVDPNSTKSGDIRLRRDTKEKVVEAHPRPRDFTGSGELEERLREHNSRLTAERLMAQIGPRMTPAAPPDGFNPQGELERVRQTVKHAAKPTA